MAQPEGKFKRRRLEFREFPCFPIPGERVSNFLKDHRCVCVGKKGSREQPRDKRGDADSRERGSRIAAGENRGSAVKCRKARNNFALGTPTKLRRAAVASSSSHAILMLHRKETPRPNEARMEMKFRNNLLVVSKGNFCQSFFTVYCLLCVFFLLRAVWTQVVFAVFIIRSYLAGQSFFKHLLFVQ